MNAAPIYKVGLILVRNGREVFLLRPKPKHPGEVAPFVLPRGSRAYRAADGTLQDVRDAATALRHQDHLEPLEETLLREAYEEAGIPTPLLQHAIAHGALAALGARPYKDYVVYWYVLHADAALCAAMVTPLDAQETRWVTLSQMQELAVPEGYQRVVREVVILT
jgi:8-oxo-dGTP pyrophosphatase MutT (NUDIX family)